MSDRTPQELVAEQFMTHKGYGDIRPYDIDKLNDEPCWYFLYDLEDGATLELEVFWNGSEWETTVTGFSLPEAR